MYKYIKALLNTFIGSNIIVKYICSEWSIQWVLMANIKGKFYYWKQSNTDDYSINYWFFFFVFFCQQNHGKIFLLCHKVQTPKQLNTIDIPYVIYKNSFSDFGFSKAKDNAKYALLYLRKKYNDKTFKYILLDCFVHILLWTEGGILFRFGQQRSTILLSSVLWACLNCHLMWCKVFEW